MPIDTSELLTLTTDRNAFNSKLIYGATGTGKTFWMGILAYQVYLQTGKRTRWICTDGGGWGPAQVFVDAGVIDPVNLSGDRAALLKLTFASEGRWPDPADPKRRWIPIEKQSDWGEIGMYIIEGLSSIGDKLMEELISDGRKISEEVVGSYILKDEATGESRRFGAPGRSHYGAVQRQLRDLIRNFGALTSKGVSEIVYTALEAKGKDDKEQAILGPMVPGKAMIGELPQRVGDCIHFDIIAVDDPKNRGKKVQEYRAYFTNHLDEEYMRAWPAKVRLGPDAVTAVKEHPEFRNGYMVLDLSAGVESEGLSKFFRWRDSLKSSVVDQIMARMARRKEELQKDAQNDRPTPGDESLRRELSSQTEGVQLSTAQAIQPNVAAEAERAAAKPFRRPPTT